LFFNEYRFVGEHFGFGNPVQREVRVTNEAIIVRDFGLPIPPLRLRAIGKEEATNAFPIAVPFSPGYGRHKSQT
jgi:hypothetical protein